MTQESVSLATFAPCHQRKDVRAFVVLQVLLQRPGVFVSLKDIQKAASDLGEEELPRPLIRRSLSAATQAGFLIQQAYRIDPNDPTAMRLRIPSDHYAYIPTPTPDPNHDD